MILIENIFIEESILTTPFCCHLSKCLGACCIEGESGAPLKEEELKLLEEAYPKIKNYLPNENQKILEKNGLYIRDSDGDWTTPLIEKKGPCIYAIFENNIAFCSIEKAWKNKKIQWPKPLSCHLYPIRVEYKNGFTYLRYHQWDVCKPALKPQSIPLFRFLKFAIVRAFGENLYNELEMIYASLSKSF